MLSSSRRDEVGASAGDDLGVDQAANLLGSRSGAGASAWDSHLTDALLSRLDEASNSCFLILLESAKTTSSDY